MTDKIAKYVSAKGVTTYRVAWRFQGVKQTATLDSMNDARALKGAVEARGHQVRAKDDEVVSGAIYGRGTLVATSGAPLWPVVAAEYSAQASGQRANTTQLHDTILRLHLSRWDRLPVDQITRADVVALVRDYDMEYRGRGYRNFALARSIFRYALAQRYIDTDPSTGIKFTASAQPQHMFWTETEQALIIVAATQVDPYVGQMVALMLGTGLRVGELTGLQRRDFHGLTSKAPSLTISRSLRCGVVGPTKSGKPRTIELGPTVTAAMIVRLRELPSSDTTWVWPSPFDAEQGVKQDLVRDHFALILDRAVELGLDPSRRGRVHDLRHTHASTMLERGMTMLAVSLRLGHASIVTTQQHYASIGQGGRDQTYRLLG